MYITRADTLTATQKKLEYYSDFLDNFDRSPIGNELGRAVNEKSINQSIRNLLFTDYGERMFQPTIGCDLRKSLFELKTPENSDYLIFTIKNTLTQYETRINVIDVYIDDGFNHYSKNTSENEISISITYALINKPDPITITLLLKRAR